MWDCLPGYAIWNFPPDFFHIAGGRRTPVPHQSAETHGNRVWPLDCYFRYRAMRESSLQISSA
jgi:hypothetical protein